MWVAADATAMAPAGRRVPLARAAILSSSGQDKIAPGQGRLQPPGALPSRLPNNLFVCPIQTVDFEGFVASRF